MSSDTQRNAFTVGHSENGNTHARCRSRSLRLAPARHHATLRAHDGGAQRLDVESSTLVRVFVEEVGPPETLDEQIVFGRHVEALAPLKALALLLQDVFRATAVCSVQKQVSVERGECVYFSVWCRAMRQKARHHLHHGAKDARGGSCGGQAGFDSHDAGVGAMSSMTPIERRTS